jgi:orotidine-5'-phosphate decarboxylase
MSSGSLISARFADRLRQRAAERHSWLCVGIDPDLDMLPSTLSRNPSGITIFCRQVIEATSDYAASFKLNFAFFEALGGEGLAVLKHVRNWIPTAVPVIADAKRGDIGNTARAYARAILDVFNFDAVTVSPYLGWDALDPFLEKSGKGIFVLSKTSNPGASDIQDLPVEGEPLYLRVAREALARDGRADVGLVVGATQLEALRRVRALSQEAVILAPGIGAQGGQAANAMAAGANGRGENLLLTASRSILFASDGEDYADAARWEAQAAARLSWLEERHAGADC